MLKFPKHSNYVEIIKSGIPFIKFFLPLSFNLLKRIRLYLCNCLLKTFPVVGITGKICPVSLSLTAAVFWLCKGSVISSFLIRSLLNDLMLRYYFFIVYLNLVFGWKIPPLSKDEKTLENFVLFLAIAHSKLAWGLPNALLILLFDPYS